MTNPSSYKFDIVYDAQNGDFSRHVMSAKQLGEAITAMSGLIEDASELLNPHEEAPVVRVTAPAKEGSFAVSFELAWMTAGHAIEILRYLGIGGVASTIVGGSLWEVSRRLGDKNIINVETTKDSDQATIQVDGADIMCEENVALLATNPKIRAHIAKLVSAPLQEKNAPVFKIVSEQNTLVELKDQQVTELVPMPPRTKLADDVSVESVNVRFPQVNFNGPKGWKMELHGKEHTVTMDDEAFLEQVKANEKSFSKEDLFEVDLEITEAHYAQAKIAKKTSYAIKKVTRHRTSNDRKII